uniref:Uncharacterized protein n=1 Tax=Acrobeloides nanus TaxID=290746 RepID=A0A914CPV5_9BILA
MSKILGIFIISTFLFLVDGQLCDNGQIVEISQGKSCLFGYHFDGPIERGTWRTIWWIKSGGQVTDCNSYCVYLGHHSGYCKSSQSEDVSTWCPGKSTCTCA